MNLNSETKEAQSLVKDIEKGESQLPDKEKNILDWSMKELQSYITDETASMKKSKRMKFAMQLNKRILKEKERRKNQL